MNEQRIGDWRVICDRTGFKCWASETVLQWDGARVRRQSVEPRQPQDFLHGVKDDSSVPWARPEAADVFIEPGDVGTGDL